VHHIPKDFNPLHNYINSLNFAIGGYKLLEIFITINSTENQVLKSAETKTSLFFFTPQYTTFNIFKYISHFETVTILSSTSGFVLSAFLNFKNIVNYENLNMLVWQFEEIFSTAHTNLCDWLRMLCLRASDHAWIDLSQVMTSKNVFIYTGFQHYDYYIVLIFLVEFYIILPLTFILPSCVHNYHVDLW